MKVIDKLAWIEIQNRKVLSTLSKGKDTYYIPGGKREEGESDETALIREIKEELSVELLPHSLRYMETFQAPAHGHPEGVFVKMTCYQADYQGQLQAAAEIESYIWLDSSDMGRISPVDKIIFLWLKERGWID